MDESGGTPINYEALEEYLKTLGYARRLELLSMLQAPHAIDEIRLAPGPARAGANPGGAISRQALQGHMEKLEEAGLVRVGHRGRGRRGVQEYVLDHARLFAIIEELRRICSFEAGVPLDPLATQKIGGPASEAWPAGPKLILVHGVREGRVFPLRASHDPTSANGRGWVIGRAKEADVCLDYDPFVSSENAEVLLRPDKSYAVIDIRSARNGTLLNWARIPPGGEAPLRDGDIIGVGRSLLVFRRE